MRVLLVALAVAGGAAAVGVVTASAECCMGPLISVSLPYDAPLRSVLLASAAGDDPNHHADGDVRAVLDVAGQRVADLGSVHLSDVSPTPQPASFSLNPEQLATARAAGAKAHSARGVIHFAVSGATDRLTGTVAPDYATDSIVSLHDGVRTTRPTRLSLGGIHVAGTPNRLQGSVAFRVPHAWPRLSSDGAAPGAFGPIVLENGCDAYLLVQSVAVAVRDPAAYVARVGGLGDTVASGSHGVHRWRLRATPTPTTYGGATAVGISRVAPHRYAGLRVDVRFDPTCPASSTRSPELITGLKRLVREMQVKALIS